MSMTESRQTIEFDAALLAAAERAMTKYPADERRILAGVALVQADAVTDYAAVTPYAFTVASARDPERRYSVAASPRSACCTCPDFARTGSACKHLYAVWLTVAARRERANPRQHLAYHLLSGEHGRCRTVSDGRMEFSFHGSSKRFLCEKGDLCIGPIVQPEGRL